MPRSSSSHNAFTLIEVMVAVMIVSIIIAALLQMQGNSSNKLFGIQKMMQTNQYNSFLLGLNAKYGFEHSNIDMNRLAEDFELESDLRRKLKALKAEVEYNILSVIDTSEFDDTVDDETAELQSSTTGIVFEIGKTKLKTEEFTLQLIRVRQQ